MDTKTETVRDRLKVRKSLSRKQCMARLKRGRARYLGQNVGPQHEEHQEQSKDHAHVEGGVESDLRAFGQRDERFTDDQDDPQVRPFNHVFGVIQRQHTAMMLDLVCSEKGRVEKTITSDRCKHWVKNS